MYETLLFFSSVPVPVQNTILVIVKTPSGQRFKDVINYTYQEIINCFFISRPTSNIV